MAKYNFCTLFDTNYSAQGLAMYKSLKRYCKDFHLYIFAFDETLPHILKKIHPKHATVIPLSEFEDEELLKVKPTRTRGEYCWTCSSSTILYCIKKYDLSHCTYIDSDLYFYANPSILIEEMGESDDVLITSHRYTSDYDQTNTSGKYCVQFMTFKNTENGLNILRWWRNACLDWCYNRMEDGKFGDQKYLDDWPERFNGVHELEHLGGGVSPWNMQQYSFHRKKSGIEGTELDTQKHFNLIFFHFHGLRCHRKGLLREYRYTVYRLPRSVRKYIYNSYLPRLIWSHYRIRMISPRSNCSNDQKIEFPTYKRWFKEIFQRFRNHEKGYLYWIG
jgi:hypothetical protein